MLIVTPNPAIDYTVRLTELRVGEVLRTGPGAAVAGGKGGNVARAARCLGVDAAVLALTPQGGRERLEALYAAEGFALRSVPVAGEVRTCTAIIEDGGRVTLLNEPGANVTDADWARLLDSVREHCATAEPPERLILCSGSLPPGAPIDGYAQIVRIGHEQGCEVIVDASREVLAHALAAGADLVSPNVSEAEAALSGSAEAAGEPVDDDGADVPERARAAAAGLLDRGARWAVVTAGSAGAAISGPDFAAWLPAPAVIAANPIGAGDSFLAGVATARLAGRDWPGAVRRGLASGSASVEQARAGVLDPARVDELERALGAS